jgi:hypothetical protein
MGFTTVGLTSNGLIHHNKITATIGFSLAGGVVALLPGISAGSPHQG